MPRRVVVVASLVAWALALRPWHWSMNDLAIYRAGGEAVLHGADLYGFRATAHHLGFTYPPFAAVCFVPLALAGATASRLVLTALSIGLYAVVLRIVVQRLREEQGAPMPAVAVLVAIAVWLEPFRATISFGQINVLVMALVVLDVLDVGPLGGSGLLVGVAAALKLTPLAFLPFLYATGRRRQSLQGLLTFVTLGLAAALVSVRDSREYWAGRLFLSAHHVGRVENASNQTVRGVLARLLRTTHVPGWWLLVAAAVYLSGTLLAVWVWRRGRRVWSLTVMALTTLLVSPISWSHHWVWSVLLLAGGVGLARARPTWPVRVGVGLVLVPLFAGMPFWAPHTAHRELTDSGVQQLASASYVLAAVAFILVVLTVVRGAEPAPAGPAAAPGGASSPPARRPRWLSPRRKRRASPRTTTSPATVRRQDAAR